MKMQRRQADGKPKIYASIKKGKWEISRKTPIWRRGTDDETGEKFGSMVRLQKSLATLPWDTVELAPEFIKQHRITEEEHAYLEQKMLIPARAKIEAKKLQEQTRLAEVEARRLDPNWRLDDAERLVREAIMVCGESGSLLNENAHRRLRMALTDLAPVKGLSMNSGDATVRLIIDACEALARAARDIEIESFPYAPDAAVREQPLYKQWQELKAVLQSLQAALQRKRYVKAKA
jgi:hypothetical protein